jgi:hypothetical protein
VSQSDGEGQRGLDFGANRAKGRYVMAGRKLIKAEGVLSTTSPRLFQWLLNDWNTTHFPADLQGDDLKA